MRPAMQLTIATPASLVVENDAVRSLRAADASGGFGILPGHADLLTVLPASIVQWREDGSQWRYCAVRAGVLEVTGGNRIAIACRQAVLGDDLETLEGEVRGAKNEQIEADRKARVEQLRFHTAALRQILRYLLPGSRQGGVRSGDGETFR